MWVSVIGAAGLAGSAMVAADRWIVGHQGTPFSVASGEGNEAKDVPVPAITRVTCADYRKGEEYPAEVPR
jgi:hypothetical protein